MSEKKPEATNGSGRGSRRGSTRPARGKLRRFFDIENVVVEEPFSLFKPSLSGGDSEDDRKGGDGCYVSATIHNRRYYGLLVDQEALKNASLLWFQEEAASLDLNRRMKMLQGQASVEGASRPSGTQVTNGSKDSSSMDEGKKRPAVTSDADGGTKRIKLESEAGGEPVPMAVSSAAAATQDQAGGFDSQTAVASTHKHQVQKFRYVEHNAKATSKDLGYRVLLATFADIGAASEDDAAKGKLIEDACQAGGGFVGKYYYQYEVMRNTLQTAITISDKPNDLFRTSMGFDSFLLNTHLPSWFPLANMHIGQHKVLSLLNMKKDNNGNVVWDADAESAVNASALTGTHVPMESRSRYRIGVMGGGIAGLACALELLRLCDNENIDLEVVLLEGRSRLGGRLLTDKTTFKRGDGKTPFPVDLGAGWIHGIDHNPLAALAREAGVSFVTASEEVKMMHGGLREVDQEVDDKMGKLFDDLLDLGADDCWGANDSFENGGRNQMAVRWYSANLPKSGSDAKKCSVVLPDISASSSTKRSEANVLGLKKTDAPSHRHSSDMSIDIAIARAIQTHKFRDFSKLTKDEHLMLEWNMKNVEYALGANVSDLSMKFWDSDERHAFEGDHVLLREGYTSVVDYMVQKLEQYGEHKFKLMLNFPVGKVQYARRSTREKYPDRKQRKLVELSDACCVTAEDESRSVKCDFVVCTLPLGVLKHAVEPAIGDDAGGNTDADAGLPKLVFEPPLPQSKRDTIKTVGFGLLDKLYLQFTHAFWREPLGLQGDKYLFGNSSGLHSHYYMFTDVGLTLATEEDSPPILMTLISGKEAVHCEMLSKEDMVKEALATLAELLKPIVVPAPIAVKRTRWGCDRFSRGCYTFLPPGATDQDFSMLQSPINGNGDSLLLEGSETMRMFFAGEHTTALHPSMAHGAMLSGIRAAKEIVSTLSFNFRSDKASDRLIPVALFRRDNPNTPLQCSLCHEMGSRVREGSLLALKRGARQVLVHNNCAENSPEVEVYEGQWRNVIKAVNRGKGLNCALCARSGATIGCTHPNCYKVFHFSCSEDSGWRFDREGKVFYCDLHRKMPNVEEADRVSLEFYRTKTRYAVFKCFLCGGLDDDDSKVGKLFAFQHRNRRALVHEKCARFTTIVDTKEDTESRMGIEFANIFEAIDKAVTCTKCEKHGATVGCASCDRCYHLPCALELGWKSEKRGSNFLCEQHAKNRHKNGGEQANETGGLFQHALFSGISTVGDGGKTSMPSNSEVGTDSITKTASAEETYISDDSSDSGESVQGSNPTFRKFNKDLKLSKYRHVEGQSVETKEVRVSRTSDKGAWSIDMTAKLGSDGYILTFGNGKILRFKSTLEEGQIIKSINGLEVGAKSLGTFKEVLSLLEKHVEIIVEVVIPKDDSKVTAVTSDQNPGHVVVDHSKGDSKPAATPSDQNPGLVEDVVDQSRDRSQPAAAAGTSDQNPGRVEDVVDHSKDEAHPAATASNHNPGSAEVVRDSKDNAKPDQNPDGVEDGVDHSKEEADPAPAASAQNPGHVKVVDHPKDNAKSAATAPDQKLSVAEQNGTSTRN